MTADVVKTSQEATNNPAHIHCGAGGHVYAFYDATGIVTPTRLRGYLLARACAIRQPPSRP